jgi:hypothetical protein
VIWLGTAGGKRMPIDPVLRKVFYAKDVRESNPVLTEYQAYTSHLTTCPFKERFSKIT